jgi:hypothetical protein
MTEITDKKNDGLDLTLQVSTFGLIIFLTLTICVYRSIFPGDFSHDPNSWSAFGSFIGGLFGPLVSFVALIAILRTIKLQKIMLETQRHEFEKMLEAQEANLHAQKEQIDLSVKSAEENAVVNYRLSVFKMVEHQINFYNSQLESIFKRIQIFVDVRSQSGVTLKDEQLTELSKRKEIVEARISGLHEFMMSFSLKNHASIKEIQLDVSENFVKAYDK